MPLHFHGMDPESIRRRLLELERVAEDEREDRRQFVRSIGMLIFWPLVALLGMGWGFQMNDVTRGVTVFNLSLAMGNFGVFWTLISEYRRRG